MSKKAQGLSVNAIIIAAIALIVLVVLVSIFTGRLGIFSKGLGEATSCNQICASRDISSINCAVGKGTNGDETPSDGYQKLAGARDGQGKQCWYKPV